MCITRPLRTCKKPASSESLYSLQEHQQQESLGQLLHASGCQCPRISTSWAAFPQTFHHFRTYTKGRKNNFHFFIALHWPSSPLWEKSSSHHFPALRTAGAISRLDAHCFTLYLLASSPRALPVAASGPCSHPRCTLAVPGQAPHADTRLRAAALGAEMSTQNRRRQGEATDVPQARALQRHSHPHTQTDAQTHRHTDAAQGRTQPSANRPRTDPWHRHTAFRRHSGQPASPRLRTGRTARRSRRGGDGASPQRSPRPGTGSSRRRAAARLPAATRWRPRPGHGPARPGPPRPPAAGSGEGGRGSARGAAGGEGGRCCSPPACFLGQGRSTAGSPGRL